MEAYQKILELSTFMQDELSRRIFWARLQADADLACFGKTGMGGLKQLADIFEESNKNKKIIWSEKIIQAIKEKRRIVVYVARMTGVSIAALMLASDIDFTCFCSRGAERFPNGLLGKSVLSPEVLFQSPENTLVIIAARNVYNGHNEILNGLKQHGFALEQIISFDEIYRIDGLVEQYFEFPNLFRKGTAFLDCGAENGSNSLTFAEWYQGDYSRIYAFEPDSSNYIRCKSVLENAGVQNVVVHNCGLLDRDSFVKFWEDSSSSSYICAEDENQATYMQKVGTIKWTEKIKVIETSRIDDVVGKDIVGFIKMDIEGSELAALRGGCETIKRDKPLLALSVYHKPGDVMELMEYCKRLVPEYNFWLRQYAAIDETVLYASVRGRDTTR